MSDAPSKPASPLDGIVKSATRAERTVTVCVAGDLNAQFDTLEQELDRLVGEKGVSLDDPVDARRREVAEQIEDLRARMADHEHRFTFRALSSQAWSDLTAAHPARPDVREPFNRDTFPLAAVAASLVSIDDVPVTHSETDLRELWNEALNTGQCTALFEAAWEANTGRMSVPFSPLASATLAFTDKK